MAFKTQGSQSITKVGNKMASERELAELAEQASQQPHSDTVFGRIIRHEIPATFLYEDDKV